ncbi:MAG: SUMF1/EgtB/PvdO family nonheme iron enzyme [Bacteroidales bacterium]|nr:SUMF1/EgtB/PvdO family nonheme iron enzyme [Bacteroidales bacterium]MBQ6069044.1 SUMF1/EgtB/PvdO family nonheme iron enzyme [Bacteroidales bacterium]
MTDHSKNDKTNRDLIEQNAKGTGRIFWGKVAVYGLLLCLVAVGVLWAFNTNTKVSAQERMINELKKTTLRDSTPVMQSSDVRILVEESTKETLNTYINSQNSFLEIIGVLITVLVAVFGFAVPFLTNKEVRDSNEKWLREKTEESKNKISNQMSSELDKSKEEISNELKEGLKQLKEETERQKKEINELKEKFEKILDNKQNLAEHAESLKEVNEERDIDRKIAKLKEEIKKHPNDYPAEGYYELGLAQSENGEIEDAVSNFMIAIDRKPDYVEAYHALAKAYCNKHDYKKAWENIEKAILLKQEDSEMLMTRCQIFKGWGLIENIKKDAEHGIELAKKAGNGGLLTDFRRLQDELSKIKDTDESPIEISVGKETFRMVKVKGGVFTMGATSEQGDDAYSDESPAHSVLLDDYCIGETVVTQGLWKAVMGDNPSRFKGNDLPVEGVSWDAAQEFISMLNKMTGRKFRFPTEAEWEYAARGGKKSRGNKYSGSNNIKEVAWYMDNSGGQTRPVKGKKANELGLYDMSGNVWEWCQDWFGKYSGEAQCNPQGPGLGSDRVLRGGNWDSFARGCRVSYRHFNTPMSRNHLVGFRLVMCP